MFTHPTYERLTRVKLFGMAHAFAKQSTLDLNHLGFKERLGLLFEHEASERDREALAPRLRHAKPAAEDSDYRHALPRQDAVQTLAGQPVAAGEAESTADRHDRRGQPSVSDMG